MPFLGVQPLLQRGREWWVNRLLCILPIYAKYIKYLYSNNHVNRYCHKVLSSNTEFLVISCYSIGISQPILHSRVWWSSPETQGLESGVEGPVRGRPGSICPKGETSQWTPHHRHGNRGESSVKQTHNCQHEKAGNEINLSKKNSHSF